VKEAVAGITASFPFFGDLSGANQHLSSGLILNF
jgi:hypothetical protein